MKAYLFLLLAITAELFGTSMLKASNGFTKVLPTIGVFVGFAISFYSLSLSLRAIPLSVAYAIWSGLGTVATVIIGILIWKEKVSPTSIIGILLIIIGVVLVNLHAPASETIEEPEGQVEQYHS